MPRREKVLAFNFIIYDVCPHLDNDKQACSQNLVADMNHLERIQRLSTGLVTGLGYVCFSERPQIPCSGDKLGFLSIDSIHPEQVEPASSCW